MMLKGYDEDLCPFIQEVRDYELRDKTVTRDMMRQLDTSFNEWVRDKHEFLNFNEEGELINELPPILTNVSDQIGFVREVLQRKRENRFMPYDI
jgi:nucleoid-associated protein YejK